MTNINELIVVLDARADYLSEAIAFAEDARLHKEAAQALRLLNDVYEAAKGVSWPGPMLEKAIAAAQEKVDE